MVVQYLATQAGSVGGHDIAGFAGYGGQGAQWSFDPGARYTIADDADVGDSLRGLVTPIFRSGQFTGNRVAGVSGLTACVGLIVFSVNAGGTTPDLYTVTHFNGNIGYRNTFAQINTHLGAAATKRAIIVFSSTANEYQRDNDGQTMRGLLTGVVGIADVDIMIYHDTVNGGAFYLKGDGNFGALPGVGPLAQAPQDRGHSCCIVQ